MNASRSTNSPREAFGVQSAPNKTLLIFALATPVSSDALPAFPATNETSEMTVITSPTELAFPLHSEMANAWFAGRRGGLH
jgi:hypothetical protein